MLPTALLPLGQVQLQDPAAPLMLLHGSKRLEQLTIMLFVWLLLNFVRSSLTLIFDAKAIVREASGHKLGLRLISAISVIGDVSHAR